MTALAKQPELKTNFGRHAIIVPFDVQPDRLILEDDRLDKRVGIIEVPSTKEGVAALNAALDIWEQGGEEPSAKLFPRVG